MNEILKYFPHLTEVQRRQLEQLAPLYADWNEKINVISRKDIDHLYEHHVLHSMAIAMAVKFRSGTQVLDLGTGGGFPGIPLAILFPDAHFVLCDSVGKKTIVAQAVASALGLKNVQVVNARAESLATAFNFVVSRAVASLTDFYPWVKGKFSKGILYLKGGDVVEEIAGVMARHRLRKGSVHTWPVSSWLKDPYYEGKLVIHLEK